MLYRKPQSSVAAVLRSVALRIGAAFSAFRREGADAALFDSLRDEQLRDLGVRRIESRDVRFYR